MRIGIFGGTFDPPHLGHLVAAGDAHHRLQLDRLVFVPAAQPPHKQGRVHTPPELRLRMVQAAVVGDDRFAVDDLELQRHGPSYTVDTLREFRRRFPRAELFLVLGADALREFATWYQPHEVARLATLVMLTRGGDEAIEVNGITAQALPVPRVDISATEIRRRIAAAEPIRYLVSASVQAIIEQERLYQRHR